MDLNKNNKTEKLSANTHSIYNVCNTYYDKTENSDLTIVLYKFDLLDNF